MIVWSCEADWCMWEVETLRGHQWSDLSSGRPHHAGTQRHFTAHSPSSLWLPFMNAMINEYKDYATIIYNLIIDDELSQVKNMAI